MAILASDELVELAMVSAKEKLALETAGLSIVQDLLDYLPRRYEDRRRFDHFPVQVTGEAMCLRGSVIDCQRKGFGGRRSFFRGGGAVARWIFRCNSGFAVVQYAVFIENVGGGSRVGLLR